VTAPAPRNATPRPAARRGAARHRSPEATTTLIAVTVWVVCFGLVWVITGWQFVPSWLIGGGLATFLIYALDKTRAIRGARRVPERVLQAMVLLGGVLGGWAGMLGLRHKTLHRAFWVVQWIATALWAALAWWLWLGD
jgi:uncharacterized membrane protein YsdA (DUF1294 family)